MGAPDLAFGGGVVHRDVETAKPRDGLVDQSADVILLADVGVNVVSNRQPRSGHALECVGSQ
jgi:hypothetical protein